MKIVINGKFYAQRLTGVQRFAREIVAELDRICGGAELEIVLPAEAADHCPEFQRIRKVIRGTRASSLWEQTVFARYVRREGSVSLNLCNSAPLFAPKIVCMHDMKPFAHPEFFTKKFVLWYRALFKSNAKKARAILTVSEFSKGEIEKYFPQTKGRITVIPNAWQHMSRTRRDDGAPQQYGLEKGAYYFAMCSLEPNKNLKWIIETAKRNQGATFAVAGGVNGKIFAKTETSLPENVKLIGYVTDGASAALMRDCRAFLFVTRYEGFGLPPLEALSAGAPCVIVSDTQVMHEVLGENAVYVSPDDYKQNLAAIAIPTGRDCLERYSWETSAKKLYGLLQTIAKEETLKPVENGRNAGEKQ